MRTKKASFEKNVQIEPFRFEKFFSEATMTIPDEATLAEARAYYEELFNEVKADVMDQIRKRVQELEDEKAPF